MVASTRLPAPRPVAKILTSVGGVAVIATDDSIGMSAALVTSRPVRPIAVTTASRAEPVASKASRILAGMKTW